MQLKRTITPCLWFDTEGEAAANFYTAIFPNSRITSVVPHRESSHEFHRERVGTVMVVTFELDGQQFTALNGGPYFKFNEAVSFQIFCETQEEVDHYWNRLSEGGDEHAQQCGWLKDQYGVSWQVVPAVLLEMIQDPDAAKARRATDAMMEMKKLDIAELQRAFDGTGE
jgi:predicted 3-demethylubiquinone-9 3-methyltransferase (glyoxalase superfamily)